MRRRRTRIIKIGFLILLIVFIVNICGVIITRISTNQEDSRETITAEEPKQEESPEEEPTKEESVKEESQKEEPAAEKVEPSEPVATTPVVATKKSTIYLTFDDGPGAYTNQLLDILKKYKIKATFFVTGAGSDDLIKREYEEGHAIGLHTLSHNYSYIYSSVDNFFADLYGVQNRVKNITGYTSYLMRFPGGSSNTVSRRHDKGQHIMTKLVAEVQNRGFTYFDWNISSGDADKATNSEAVYQNVVSRIREDKDSVILQHDIKGFSVGAVERIINWGLENGYTFDKLSANSYTAHHAVNN